MNTRGIALSLLAACSVDEDWIDTVRVTVAPEVPSWSGRVLLRTAEEGWMDVAACQPEPTWTEVASWGGAGTHELVVESATPRQRAGAIFTLRIPAETERCFHLDLQADPTELFLPGDEEAVLEAVPCPFLGSEANDDSSNDDSAP